MVTRESNKTLTLQDLGKIAQHLQQLNDSGLIHVKTNAMPDFHSIVATLNLVATGKMEIVEIVK